VYGTPPRPRLRCHYVDEDGAPRKHGLRPAPKPSGMWDELPGSTYSVGEAATALADLARGITYTEAARRAQVNHGLVVGDVPDELAVTGTTVAGWLDRFGPAIVEAHGEQSWPQTLVLDSTEFEWTNPRTGDKQQMFAVLAAWGYPAGARRGRLWALAAAPSDNASAWGQFLRQMPGRPELVVYDSDKAIHGAVRRRWHTVPIHLCEHHLYVNAVKHLREDGQGGWGNTYRTLLAAAGQSAAGWAAFRQVVLATPGLGRTQAWVRHWDAQMTAQTSRRATMPPHYSTGALDPQLAVVREMLERRAWTFRNLARMNLLLGLVRLRVNRMDVTDRWAAVVAEDAASHLAALTAADDRRHRPAVAHASRLDEQARYLLDGSREYSLRKHPVPARA